MKAQKETALGRTGRSPGRLPGREPDTGWVSPKMVAQVEEADKLEAGPCAGCAETFPGELLDDERLCAPCDVLAYAKEVEERQRSTPEGAAEWEAAQWFKANPGLVLTDEWAEKEWEKTLLASLRKCSTCKEEYLPTVNTRRDGRCFNCQNIPLGQALHGPIKGVVTAKNAWGLAQALSLLTVKLRYNTRAHRAEMQHNANDWQPFNDRLAAKLRDVLGKAIHLYGQVRGDAAFELRAQHLGRCAQRDSVLPRGRPLHRVA